MKILNKIKFIALLLIILMQFIFIPVPKAQAYSNPATVPLLTVSNFAALAKSEITNAVAGTVLNNGDMGLDSPATCTGFPSPCTGATTNGTINNGVIQYQNAVALQGQTDATAAVTNIGLRSSNETLATAIGGQTLTQGVYTVGHDDTANITGDLTLNGDANSVFIFHLTSDLVTATGSRVLLTGGAQACNVFWKVDSSATFNGTTQMVGTVLAQASVTFPGGGATLNGRAIAQTAAITFDNTTVNNSSCATAASSTSISSSSTDSTSVCPTINSTVITPIIIESRRISPTSIFISWGPYSGIDTFNVRYGLENGKWLYSTNITGFSTTLNDIPSGQPIWIQIAAKNDCSVGTYGEARLVGQTKVGNSNVLGASIGLPNTGFAPHKNNIPWYILVGILVGISIPLVLIQRKYKS